MSQIWSAEQNYKAARRAVVWVGLGAYLMLFMVMVLYNVIELRAWNNQEVDMVADS